MDDRLKEYYERELRYLRDKAGDFARLYPRVARRLNLEDFLQDEEVADPYVERILEGAAFLTSRVQLQMDLEFPRFTNALLETIYPHYLAPTPSMAVVCFEPDPREDALAGGPFVPRLTTLRSAPAASTNTSCVYRTAHEIRLWPIAISRADYVDRELPSLGVPKGLSSSCPAGLRLRLRALAGLTFDEIKLDTLSLYFRGAGRLPARLYEQCLGRCVAFFVQSPGSGSRPSRVLPARTRRVGMTPGEALLPVDTRTFQGYRLLTEYFAFPERFMFVELGGLRSALAACGGDELELYLLFNQEDPELKGAVTEANFALHCTPAINLFSYRPDRVVVNERANEFQVIPDRTRPLDYEVYRVDSVLGYGTSTTQPDRVYEPFYASAQATDEIASGYFAVSRTPRSLSDAERHRGVRSSYTGSDVAISLVDEAGSPHTPNVRELGLEVLCTNRDLARRMPVGVGRTDFYAEESFPIASIRCVGKPSDPKPSFAEGDTAWRLISHLSLNHLTLQDTIGGSAADAFRDVLRLYADLTDPGSRRQVEEGVVTLRSRPVVERAPTPGPASFIRGIGIEIELSEQAFGGIGAFLFGAVAEQVFSRFVSTNSFTQTTVSTRERGEIMAWPATLGRRQIL